MFTILSKSIVAVIVVLILWANIGYCSSIQSKVSEGNVLFTEGKYELAVHAYQETAVDDLENPLLNYNLGTALYKLENYSKAVEHLQKALLSENVDIKNNGAFNLGNAYYKNGMAQVKNDLDFAIKALEKSIDQYKNILLHISSHEDARVNKEIVEKELKKLKQLKNQQTQNQQQKQQQDQEDFQNQQKQDEQQNQQDQQQDQKNNSGMQNQDSSGNKDSFEDDNHQSQDQQQAQKEKNNLRENMRNSSRERQMNNTESQSVSIGELTMKEVERLLSQYQQKEEPQGLLNFYISDSADIPVIKDW